MTVGFALLLYLMFECQRNRLTAGNIDNECASKAAEKQGGFHAFIPPALNWSTRWSNFIYQGNKFNED